MVHLDKGLYVVACILYYVYSDEREASCISQNVSKFKLFALMIANGFSERVI